MKRNKDLITDIAMLNNLYLAFWKAQKGKQEKLEVREYRCNLDVHLFDLQTQVLDGKLEVGNYHYFTIYDPKERIICAAAFPERVLHHALMNVCHPIFEDFQIHDSYATRIGKGTYAALDRASSFQRKNDWFLKMDVRKYFDTIDHEMLLLLLEHRFRNPHLLSIFKQIIGSYAVLKGKGLPIGNLTSQYFANFYLAFLDRFIKEKLKIKAYVRYMDDMVLWSNDKQQLLAAKASIEDYLADVLQLKLKIAYLNKASHGLEFLGYRLFKNHRILSRRSKQRFERKLKQYYRNLESGLWSQEDFRRHAEPLLAFTQHASSKSFRRKVLKKMGE